MAVIYFGKAVHYLMEQGLYLIMFSVVLAYSGAHRRDRFHGGIGPC